jgi:hypothetical protein
VSGQDLGHVRSAYLIEHLISPNMSVVKMACGSRVGSTQYRLAHTSESLKWAQERLVGPNQHR